jgi:copper chaperone CopZ
MALFAKTTTIALDIEGMTCGHCVQTVTKALAGVPGGRRAEVDLKAHAATVEAKEGTATEALVAAVAEAGYTAHPRA